MKKYDDVSVGDIVEHDHFKDGTGIVVNIKPKCRNREFPICVIQFFIDSPGETTPVSFEQYYDGVWRKLS